jgi:PPOX class probable F420-dependent enzyme
MASLDDPQIRAFLAEGTRTGHLGWTASDGRPVAAPVWFVLDGDRIAFNTGAATAKGRALRRDPRVVMTVDLPEPPYGFVQIQGAVHIGEDLAEVRRIATATGARYMGAERAEEFGARNGVPGELVVWIEPIKVIAQLNATD